jgi:DNA (cytosine-5)-methyltransferase 1
MLTGVSLFAGVGGFDLAMERNGVNVVANVEIDKHCQVLLERKFPNAKQFNDVTTVKGKDLIDVGFNPSRGIITGGFPCQDLSVAGKRAGLAGERSGLFWEIARVVEETQTEWFILENVPGLLSSNEGKDFGVVLGTMADLGYSVAWRTLDAQHFGVPQRRRRVFVVGRRSSDGGGPDEVLFKPQSLRRNLKTNNTERQESTSNLTRGTREAGWLTTNPGVTTTVTSKWYKGSGGPSGSEHYNLVLENPIVGTLQARDYKGVGNQYVEENKLVVEQKSQSSEQH